jgi:hypothetical protein
MLFPFYFLFLFFEENQLITIKISVWSSQARRRSQLAK